MRNWKQTLSRQISHQNLLKLGDQHTTFFAKVTRVRQVENSLMRLTYTPWEPYITIKDIKETSVEYYSRLFCQRTSNNSYTPWSPKLVSMDMNVWLLRLPMTKVMKNVAEHMLTDKSPDPDGLMTRIFQLCWDTVKSEVTDALAHLFVGRSMVRQLNHTFLTLISKIQGAERMEEFCPISVINTLYKIHAKLIAGKLAVITLDIISNNQATFVASR